MPILAALAAVAAGILSAAEEQYDIKPWIGSIYVDFADGVHVSGNRFTSEDPSVRPGIHVRKAATDVTIENRRISETRAESLKTERRKEWEWMMR